MGRDANVLFNKEVLVTFLFLFGFIYPAYAIFLIYEMLLGNFLDMIESPFVREGGFVVLCYSLSVLIPYALGKNEFFRNLDFLKRTIAIGISVILLTAILVLLIYSTVSYSTVSESVSGRVLKSTPRP